MPIKQQLLSKKCNNLASSLYKAAFDRPRLIILFSAPILVHQCILFMVSGMFA
jgi:hypothetical protein